MAEEAQREMSGGEAMVLAAEANGIRRVFGIPGVQTYPLFDALHRHSIETIVPRHEQGAAYMAMGAAKSTGRPAAFSVVPGPGVLNASAALCTAMGNSSPVLCMTGQIPSTFVGIGRGHLHELEDQLATLKSIIKDAWRIDEPSATSAMMNQAFRTMTSGRPGPVAVEMCSDIMAHKGSVRIAPGNAGIDVPEVNDDQIYAAAKAIAKSRKPMIMCGSGAQHADIEVNALAELLSCPVTAFRSGRGVVAEDHALGVSSLAGRLLWDECDCLIGIGSRVEMPYMRWRDCETYHDRPNDGRTLIRIDIDPLEMTRFKPDFPVVADSAAACRLLIDALQTMTVRNAKRTDEIAAVKASAARLIQKIQPHIAYLEIIRDVLPRDGFLVPELCQSGFAAFFGFPVLKPRTYVSEGFQGTLGFGFSTSLGVKVANPDKPVISINGDGGFMFGVQELATAAAYGIGVVAVVFNNGAFGNVRRDQELNYEGRLTGAELQNPDFPKLAESFGVQSIRVNSLSQFRQQLARAIDLDEPVLIEVVLDGDHEVSPWRFIRMHSHPT